MHRSSAVSVAQFLGRVLDIIDIMQEGGEGEREREKERERETEIEIEIERREKREERRESEREREPRVFLKPQVPVPTNNFTYR